MSRAPFYLGLTAVVVAVIRSGRAEATAADEDSTREDFRETELGEPSVLFEAIDVPYSWGAGTPATPWPTGQPGYNSATNQREGPDGWDCSGFAQAGLVRLGLLDSSAPDRTAQGLFDLSAPVTSELDAREGDLAFYGSSDRSISHVMLISGPFIDGGLPVVGASGGGSSTFGDNPDARVKRFSDVEYRGDLVGLGRL